MIVLSDIKNFLYVSGSVEVDRRKQLHLCDYIGEVARKYAVAL